MTHARETPGVSHELTALNQQLAALLRREPAPLALGADEALNDELVICGILGGKDVGKSTLINALAQTRVSDDTAEVGKGTHRPMAFVHASAQDAVRERLSGGGHHPPVDITVHRADTVGNVVLVDLPDFDSEFQDHAQVVRRIAPRLDRILWVQTPRKIGDRAWVEMLDSVIKDPDNVHCVLNKVDELLADSEPIGSQSAKSPPTDDENHRAKAFWHCQHQWVAKSLADAGFPRDDEHRFLVAAAYPKPDAFVARIAQRWDDPHWSRYAADRPVVMEIAQLARQDLDRLRTCVLGPVAREQAQEIKEANRVRELQQIARRIRDHFELDRLVERLAQACDPLYHQRLLNEVMGSRFRAAVAAALETQLASDAQLADRVLERRVEGWPLLRLVYWPFGWLSRVLGRYFSPMAPSPRSPLGVTDLSAAFDFELHSLADRIDLLRSRLLGDHAVVIQQLQIEPRLPSADRLAERTTAAACALPSRYADRILDAVRHRDRQPSLAGRAALWFIFLWFPFLQPIITAAFELRAPDGTWQLAAGVYRIVAALSAIHLLSGFAVVAAIYVLLLAAMYARALRTVRRARVLDAGTLPLDDALDDLLVSEVVAPLAAPFREQLEVLQPIQSRLQAWASGDSEKTI